MNSILLEQIRRLEAERKRWLAGESVVPTPPPAVVPPAATPASALSVPKSVETKLDRAASELRMAGFRAPRDLSELRMACIMDEFTFRCFGQEACRLITFRPDNYREVLADTRPHLLFVESAWNGNSGAWQYRVAKYNRPSDDLACLLAWCREQAIPTVFWNKEDPFHYDRFIDNARRFDFIFTTDVNMVPRYRSIVGHERVYALPFAAQPAFHNPIRLAKPRKQKLCFAGSYYGDRHDDRRAAMEVLLDSAVPFGLDIYDRNFGKALEIYKFPDRFQPFIRGNLGYDEIERAYKGYKCLLNVNTIQDSPTMFSRRVFEILASGTPVISNPAKGLTEIFGPDLVQIGVTDNDYKRLLSSVMGDDRFYRKLQVRGIRAVMERHTYRHRLLELLSKLDMKIDVHEPRLLVMATPADQAECKAILEAFRRQVYQNRELILFGDGSMLLEREDHVRCAALPVAGQRLADLAPDAEVIAFLSARHWYGRHYLSDLVHALQYSRASIVGKACRMAVVNGRVSTGDEALEFAFTPSVRADAALFRRDSFRGESLADIVEFLRCPGDTAALAASGAHVFSADRLNLLLDAQSFAGDEAAIIEELDA